MIDGISAEVEFLFTQARLTYVWPHLDKVISPERYRPIIKSIWDEYDRMENSTKGPPSTFFLKKSQEILNPILNQILDREEDHPTWNNLLSYAFKDILKTDRFARDYLNLTPRNPKFKTYL